MDKLKFARNGVARLPPGFRFQPTDEELVFNYLKNKVFSCPLPASIIPDQIKVWEYDPWDLPSGNWEQDMYFFSHKEAKYQNSNRTKRTTNSGYWKATGSDKKIVSSKRDSVMGMKKTLVFYRGKPSQGFKSDWIMHEYRLVDSGTTACILSHDELQYDNSITQNPNLDQAENWVLCRIFSKKGIGVKNNDGVINQASSDDKVENFGPTVSSSTTDHLGTQTVSSSSSSSSSSQ
ncbi:NAC domain-containing protein 83-like [Carya illinoinensis]|uniref:NAC domain-containing protein n=1 Tax=Carya illinoinensis TaxID=32201 RepID=A0A8T1NTP9_CARIL|nr:NAC domain-containing protein 83-like [Carya illinoinensis]KAG6632792.1 hypothetical protein CIPAW_12G002800 [Carya illinoinensis]KAG6683244.1 hypothetical protein I3842_12G002300 [Carya illinoinensis]